MPEAEPRREIPDQKPFVIRGHHLSSYICFIKFNSAGEKASPIEVTRKERFMLGLLSSLSDDNDDIVSKRGLPGRAYAQDVIGTSTESADRYEKRKRELFERFISLPDDYPAELTEEIPDTICGACIAGEHCRSNNILSQVPWYDPSTKESPDLDEFLRNLNLFNLPKPTITYDIAHFSDADPEPVRRIKTTMGVVRKVLQETNTKIWSNL